MIRLMLTFAKNMHLNASKKYYDQIKKAKFIMDDNELNQLKKVAETIDPTINMKEFIK